VLPISFANKEIGIDNDSGSAPSGRLGVVDGVAAGFELVDALLLLLVVVVVFGAVVVVVVVGRIVESFDVEDGATLDVAAPTGPRPVSTVAAVSTRPPVSTAIEESGFRLKVLLLLCMGYTDPL
jgi:hypothetical protein